VRRAQDDVLLVHIRAIHRQSRATYGSRRVWWELRQQKLSVGRRRVSRLMREHGLHGLPEVRFRGGTTDSEHTEPVAPNLLARDFETSAPNIAWVGDITYLPTATGWVYLAVLLDLFSRKVIGWAMADHMRTQLCLDALASAVATRAPADGLIHHTDRGSQYASGPYRAALAKAGAVQSMSRRGNCWDNAVAESFFGTLEQELGGRTRWRDLDEARHDVGDYIHRFYNAERMHSHNDRLSPIAFEERHRALSQAAA